MENFTKTNEQNIRQIFTESTGVSVPQNRRSRKRGLIALLAVLILVCSSLTVASAMGSLDDFVFIIGTTKKLAMDTIEVKEINEPATAEYAKAQGRGPYYAAPQMMVDDDNNFVGFTDPVTQPALFYDEDTFTNVTGLEITGLDRLFGQAKWTARYYAPDEICIVLEIWNRKGIGTIIFNAEVDDTALLAVGYFAIPGYEEGSGIGFGYNMMVFPSVYRYAEGKKAYIVSENGGYKAYFTEGGIIYQLSAERSAGAKEGLKKAIRIMAGIE